MAAEMISLAKNIEELDRIDMHRQLTLSCYVAVIRATADFAIKFDPQAVDQFQHDLLQLATRLESQNDVSALKESPRAFAAVEESFQRQGEQYLDGLRRNLASTTQMLQDMMAHLTGIGTRHHESLQSDIEHLRSLQKINNLSTLHLELGDMASRMTARLESMQREHQIAVAQLQDEIRALHRELATRRPEVSPLALAPAVQTEAPPPPATSTVGPEVFAMRRVDLESNLRVKTEQGETFFLTILWLSNLAQLFSRHSPDVVLELMTASTRRLANMVTDNPLWTRWEDDCFVVCTQQPKQAAAKLSQDFAARLHGTYRITQDGKADHVQLKIAMGIVERTKDDSFDRIIQRTNQLIKSLRATP